MKIKNIIIAKSFQKRLIGLMGQKKIKSGLLIPDCRSVHTFFMRQPINIYLLDSQHMIIACRYDIKPGKIISFKKTDRNLSILELPVNKRYKQGTKLFFE